MNLFKYIIITIDGRRVCCQINSIRAPDGTTLSIVLPQFPPLRPNSLHNRMLLTPSPSRLFMPLIQHLMCRSTLRLLQRRNHTHKRRRATKHLRQLSSRIHKRIRPAQHFKFCDILFGHSRRFFFWFFRSDGGWERERWP